MPPNFSNSFAAIRRLRSSAGLVALFVLAVIISPIAHDGSNIFLQIGNLTDILRQISIIGIIALAMTFVILTGGIDLSVGSTLALSTSVTALYLTHASGNVAVQCIAGILLAAGAAAIVGLLNGMAIATLRIPAFIVTLASMIGVRGLAKRITNNENIDIGFGTDIASQFAGFVNQKWFIVGAFAGLAVCLIVILNRTILGRYIRAVGDNELASLYTGLPIRGVKILVYTITGLFTGISGILYAAENHQGNPNAGVAYELDAIAAVVIGGTSLSGGSGSVGGTIIGTLIIGILTNILRLKNVDSNVEMMIKAIIIVLAVAAQRERKTA